MPLLGRLVAINRKLPVTTHNLLKGETCTIGRAQDCDLSFPTIAVISGRHCRIFEEAGEVIVEDLR